MAEGDTLTQRPHAIFVAYPFQGHVNPSVHLAVKLASRGFTVTFINTEYIHHAITSNSNQDSTDGNDDIFSDVRKSGLDLRYVTISDGLPVSFDRSLNHDQFIASLLHVLSAHVEEAVVKILTSSPENQSPVTCIIADTFFVWPSKIAKKFKLLYVSFWTELALVFTLYHHVDLLRSRGHFSCKDVREDAIDYIPGVRTIDPKDMMSYLQESNTTSIAHQIIFSAFEDVKGADFVLCNTVQELEGDTITALQAEMPFYAVGPIFPAGFTNSCVATSLWSESDCTQWLNTKPQGSVLYISFGSYAHVRDTDLKVIANGLKLSKVSFVWVLRPDIVISDCGDPLPAGFRDEVGDRSMIISWCHQTSVLAHPAIGGFLTHCGWNSIMESIWCNVPLLCFPLLTDQFTNRKLVVDDWRVGINLSDRNLPTEEKVSENINRLMSGNSGNELRAAIREVRKKLQSAVAPGGSSEKNMDRFLKDFVSAWNSKNNLNEISLKL